MRVLVTGANGFIGGHAVAALLRAGHNVTGAVRDPEGWRRAWPGCQAVACDFNRDLDAAAWVPRLSGIDAVVNLVGILSERGGQRHERVHVLAPAALYAACRQAGVKRVVHLSALGADEAAGTAYAASKRAAEAALAETALDWIVLRPSLVYGGRAFGGTALLRGLAGLPWIVPLVGKGEQPFCPIHMDDVTASIVKALEPDAPRRATLDLAGPERVTMREILLRLRGWLGLPSARTLAVPLALIRPAAWIGERLGWPAVNATSLKMLQYGNVADGQAAERALDLEFRDFADGLASQPASVQDRWHARLYLLRPALRWLLGLVWIVSGLLGLPETSIGFGLNLLNIAGIGDTIGVPLLYAACAVDMLIGLALLLRWRVRLAGLLSLGVIAAYTAVITLVAPGLWADPLGPVVKNLPIVAATLVMMAIEDDR